MIRLALITTDSREHYKDYDNDRPYFGTAPQALLEGFKDIPDIEVHVISCSHKRTLPCEKLADNIWFYQPVVGNWGWGKSLFIGCVIAVNNIVCKINPDIVHGQGTERECAIAAVYSGYPNLLTIHGNMRKIHQMRLSPNRAYSCLASMLESHALAKTYGVICNSLHTQSLVQNRTKTTWLVPNAVRSSFFQKPPKNSRNNKIPIFLVIGLITENKQPLEILKMLKSLHTDGHDFEVRFVGTMSNNDIYAAAFREALHETERFGFARFVGILNEEELIEEMDKADALIHFPKEESFGLVIAEALSRNLTVISTSVGGIPDILNHTIGSMMYPNLEEMKIGISNWMNMRKSINPENSLLAEKRYSPSIVAQKHIEIYKEIIEVSR